MLWSDPDLESQELNRKLHPGDWASGGSGAANVLQSARGHRGGPWPGNAAELSPEQELVITLVDHRRPDLLCLASSPSYFTMSYRRQIIYFSGPQSWDLQRGKSNQTCLLCGLGEAVVVKVSQGSKHTAGCQQSSGCSHRRPGRAC